MMDPRLTHAALLTRITKIPSTRTNTINRACDGSWTYW